MIFVDDMFKTLVTKHNTLLLKGDVRRCVAGLCVCGMWGCVYGYGAVCVWVVWMGCALLFGKAFAD